MDVMGGESGHLMLSRKLGTLRRISQKADMSRRGGGTHELSRREQRKPDNSIQLSRGSTYLNRGPKR